MRGRTNADAGVQFNAIVKDCIIADGNTIVAGDFVQTTYNPSVGGSLDHVGDYNNLCELDNGNLLQVYGSTNATYSVYEKETLTLLSDGTLAGSGSVTDKSKLVNIGNNKIAFLTYVGLALKATLLVYNPSTHNITVSKSITINGNTTEGYFDAVKYADSTIAVFDNGDVIVANLDSETIIETTISNTNHTYGSRIYKYGTNKLVVLTVGQYFTVSVSSSSITLLFRTSSAPTGSSYSYYDYVRIDNNTFYGYAFKSTQTNTKSYALIRVNSDDTVTFTYSQESISSAIYTQGFQIESGQAVLFRLNNNKLYVANLITEMETITPVFEELYNIGSYSSPQMLFLQLSDNSIFKFFYKISTTLNYMILYYADNNIDIGQDTIYVKAFSSYISGVAKQSGTAGDQIEVYIPQVSS